MRTRAVAAGLIGAVALATTACSYTGDGPLLTKDDLSGDTTSESRHLTDFTSVSVGGYADLTVVEGTEFEVVVTADSALQEHIDTRIDGDALIISQDYSYFGTAPDVKVAVTVPHLSGVHLSGSSSASIRAASTDDLSVSVSGSADVDVAADPSTLALTVSGSGTIAAHGTVATALIQVSGSGDVGGEDLTTADATVTVSGSGDVSLRARETLVVNVSGSGDVTYWGEPDVTKSVSGSGDVHRAAA